MFNHVWREGREREGERKRGREKERGGIQRQRDRVSEGGRKRKREGKPHTHSVYPTTCSSQRVLSPLKLTESLKSIVYTTTTCTLFNSVILYYNTIVLYYTNTIVIP